jgi:hypothetical protein
MGSNCSITYQDVNSNNGFHPDQGFNAGGKPSFSFDNCQQGGMGRTSTKVNLLSRILFRMSLAKLKAKSKKMSQTDPVKEEEKAKAEVEAELRSEKEEENLRKASPMDIIYTHLLLCSATILDGLPNKMGDTGVPTISCLIGTQKFDQAF